MIVRKLLFTALRMAANNPKIRQQAAKAADSWAISQVAAIHCRMMTKGMPDFNQKEDDYWQTLPGTMGHIRPSSEFIKKRLQEAIEKGKLVVTEKKEEAKEKAQYYQPTIQERLRKASINMAADMDDIIEQPVDEINIKEFSPLKMLRQKQAKANHGKIIKEFYREFKEQNLVEFRKYQLVCTNKKNKNLKEILVRASL